MSRPPDGPLQRAPRPLIGWTYAAAAIMALVAIAVIVWTILPPLRRALDRWSVGEPVDWAGFAAIAAVVLPFIAQLIAQGSQYLQNRSRERRDEIAFGGAPVRPFDPPPPLEDGSDVLGPRPGENQS